MSGNQEQLSDLLGLITKTTTLGRIVKSAGAKEDDSLALLRNGKGRHTIIVGENRGITYARFIAGPADTLDINFDWQFAEGLDERERAAIEKATKSWSYLIDDDFIARRIPAGTEIWDELMTANELTADDVQIMVIYTGEHEGLSTARTIRHEASSEHNEPWLGSIRISEGHRSNYLVAIHEVGHVLMTGFAGTLIPSASRYVNREDGTFEGPHAMATNGGEPVPFRWSLENGETVPPGTEGASPDLAHFGTCASFMSYCGQNTPLGPTELDAAILKDIGYEITTENIREQPETYGYGAWAQYSAWGASAQRVISGVNGFDRMRAGADAFGIEPEEPFTATAATGTASWKGSLLGVDVGSPTMAPVSGVATLTVHMDTMDGIASFEELTVGMHGETRPFRTSELQYKVNVEENGFADAGGYLNGTFYGPEHEEMAGILNDQRDEAGLIAGFGGTQ